MQYLCNKKIRHCLPISRLFWVSSLAYPNLLGTKGYVVVVVVVVVLQIETSLFVHGNLIVHIQAGNDIYTIT
jgi:hypothetical protein